MTGKERNVYEYVEKIWEQCNLYLNSEGGTEIQRIVWDDRREICERIMGKINYEFK